MSRKLSHPKVIKNRPLNIFWDDYTIPIQESPSRPPQPLELPANLKIQLTSTQIVLKKYKTRPSKPSSRLVSAGDQSDTW